MGRKRRRGQQSKGATERCQADVKFESCLADANKQKSDSSLISSSGRSKHRNGATHIFAADSSSSNRVKAAAVAHLEKPMSRTAKYRVKSRSTHKLKRHKDVLLHVEAPGDSVTKYTSEQLKSGFYFVDGGSEHNEHIDPQIPPPEDGSEINPIHIIKISNGDMDTPTGHLEDTSKGLTMILDGDDDPIFVVPPRDKIFEHTGHEGNSRPTALCNAIDEVEANTVKSAERGRGKIVMKEDDHPKYLSAGAAARRGGKGVEGVHYSLRDISDSNSKLLMAMFKQAEHLFEMFISTNQVRLMHEAMKLINPKTFTTLPAKTCSRIYSAFASGINIYLNCHKDHDFTYGCSFIHMKEVYTLEQLVVAYFCFPRLGIAVPLRPGDMIFFNPSEEHCISSRVDNKDTIYCVSLYIKSNVVGLNDNSLALQPTEASYCHSYETKYKG